jgi:CheY-like chemotaxis protein
MANSSCASEIASDAMELTLTAPGSKIVCFEHFTNSPLLKHFLNPAIGLGIAVQMATVLVVDDEPLIRSFVTEILQEEGHAVFAASCGSQALSLFQSHHREIDLLISDVVMPEMDGPALATQLQTECPGLRVLLMSGYCDTGQRKNYFDFLPKPFSIPDLLQRIRSLAQT